MTSSEPETDNTNMDENQNTPEKPSLPEFTEGEAKTAHLRWTLVNGVMQVEVETDGFQDDLNQVALMLSFTLEKLLNSTDPAQPTDQ